MPKVTKGMHATTLEQEHRIRPCASGGSNSHRVQHARFAVSMCSTGVGTPTWLTVPETGEQRCYDLIEPASSTSGPLPVLLMHHGLTGAAWQFCNVRFSGAASQRGFALICTVAIGGNWRFSSPTACNLAAAICATPPPRECPTINMLSVTPFVVASCSFR